MSKADGAVEVLCKTEQEDGVEQAIEVLADAGIKISEYELTDDPAGASVRFKTPEPERCLVALSEAGFHARLAPAETPEGGGVFDLDGHARRFAKGAAELERQTERSRS